MRVLSVAAVVLLGCSSSSTQAPPAHRYAAKPAAPAPDATPGTLPSALRREPRARAPDAGPAASGGTCQIGVPECDDYLAKYAHCISSSPKVPQSSRDMMERSLDQICKAWRQAAEQSPSSRQALAQACQTAAAAAAKAMAQFGCHW